jgi:hypothetical protein
MRCRRRGHCDGGAHGVGSVAAKPVVVVVLAIGWSLQWLAGSVNRGEHGSGIYIYGFSRREIRGATKADLTVVGLSSVVVGVLVRSS